MNSSKKIIVAIVATGAVIAGTATIPVVPAQMIWRMSYETLLFDTPDGDLGMNEYALDDGGEEWIIRTVAKQDGQPITVPFDTDVSGKTEINIIGMACYNEFLNKKGEVKRFRTDC